jgi:alpha-ketoglutarate-dependent taurine dioxygenase
VDLTPLSPGFAAEATGIDLTRPLTARQVAAIEVGLDRFPVLIFHDQHFSDDTQLAFSRNPKQDYGASNQDKLRPVRHRLVRTHPVTGRKSLYLSAHIGTIVRWPAPQARAFIRDLTEHATQRRFVHAHVRQPWDLVIRDNRTTMHRARRYDDLREVRDMRRSTIRGDAMTAPQQEAA